VTPLCGDGMPHATLFILLIDQRPHPRLPIQDVEDDENWQDDAATMKALPSGAELDAYNLRLTATLRAKRAAFAVMRGFCHGLARYTLALGLTALWWGSRWGSSATELWWRGGGCKHLRRYLQPPAPRTLYTECQHSTPTAVTH
jgi:hypothetical protein